MLTFEQIKELIDLVSERDLQSVEIERSGFRVKIDGRTARTSPFGPPEAAGRSSDNSDVADSSRSSTEEQAGVVDKAAKDNLGEEVSDLEGLHLLQSPIVGTFYTSPSPDADPYVRVGDRVKKGQVLCIIEAMKLMNEIESDENGVIEKVVPNNAQPVEFGEALFAIRAD